MFVKICGLTNWEDTEAAVEAGSTAIGFNFVRTSPRYIEPDSLAEWIGNLPTDVWRVGVFANENPARIEALSSRLGLHVAQLHGMETPVDSPRNVRVWKAARVTPAFQPVALSSFPAEAFLLDGPASGISFDWSRVGKYGQKLILAGGLDSSNVRTAIELVRPWGVDACSRLESAPGRKDHAKMRDFIQTVLSC